jgi:hypothetical protein
MSGKTDKVGQWRQVSVILRSDILVKATQRGLDISDELNQRLAELVGIDYQRQPLTGQTLPDMATFPGNTTGKRDEGTKQQLRSPILHPVINADDPAAATKVRKAKQQMPAEPVLTAPVPGTPLHPEPAVSPPLPVPLVRQRSRGKTGESKKKGKNEYLKNFVSTMITRVDADDAVISKEDMYLAFTRWCRDHRVEPVPDRKVFATLLKNKFAIVDKTVSGTMSWIHVQLG